MSSDDAVAQVILAVVGIWCIAVSAANWDWYLKLGFRFGFLRGSEKGTTKRNALRAIYIILGAGFLAIAYFLSYI